MILTPTSVTYGNEDQSWLGSAHGVDSSMSVTLKTSAFTSGTHYPSGFFPSGLALGKITSSGLYGPYASRSSEIQTLNLGAASAGTITITWDGETTAAIAYNATASAVQTALEALDNINPGDVTVTGGPLPGTNITLTFGGRYVGQNVPQITVGSGSLTGGTVTIATGTGGGSTASDGTETLAGFLLCTVAAPTVNTVDVPAAMFVHGRVIASKLPIAVDTAGRSDVAGRIQFV